MKEIALTQNQVALVDDEDYGELSKYKWCACWEPGVHGFYAARKVLTDRGRRMLRMHMLIMGTVPGLQIDHIDHNGLNNQRRNLRFCTPAQNSRNRRKMEAGSSPYKGVAHCNRPNPWRAMIYADKRVVHLGYFASEVIAAVAYDAAARQYFGEFAYVNFP